MSIIAVLDDWHRYFEDARPFRTLRGRAEVRVFTRPLHDAERRDALAGVDIAVGLRERTRFDAGFFADVPTLKLLVQTGRPGPHLDLAAATAAGVAVSSAPGGGGAGTVELTLALMIAAARRIPQSDRAVRAGEWVVLPVGEVLHGKTLGIVGMGRLGTQVARIAAGAFGMKVLAWSRSMTPERAAAAGAAMATLETVMALSDFVSLHLMLNAGTRGLVSRDKLWLMRPSAYFINTARAGVTDEPALIDMLQRGRLAGAALDVYDQEPLPPDSPLLKLDNVVLTPHVGWPADEQYEAFARSIAASVLSYWDRGEVLNLENPDALKR